MPIRSFHRLWTPCKVITFSARPKINTHSQIFRYAQSIFCLRHWPKFSDFFDLCLHWVFVVRGYNQGLGTPSNEIAFTARPKIQSQSQIFRYGQSIFCRSHRPNFSDIFVSCLCWMSAVRGIAQSTNQKQNGRLTERFDICGEL